MTNELVERLRNPNTTATNLNAIAAAKYLVWSDQFAPDFELMREALRRPCARIDGDYSNPIEMPILNFVAVRIVAQTLAQRARCHLLLHQPEEALEELTLIHEIRSMLQAEPARKPMTLVAAMINAALAGLYVETMAGGLQSYTWQTSQLTAIETQLAEINLPPLVVESYQVERAAMCEIIETIILGKMRDVHRPNFMRGWLYQNLVVITKQHQDAIDCINLANDLILPQKAEGVQRDVEAMEKHLGPYNMLAVMVIPNITKALQTVAHNQTCVNEAQIACALERYHLMHGQYPETLDLLMPQFVSKIPHDIIGGQSLHYRRTDDGKFLLYSVGWNEKDDGGVPGILSDTKKDDWVWQYP